MNFNIHRPRRQDVSTISCAPWGPTYQLTPKSSDRQRIFNKNFWKFYLTPNDDPIRSTEKKLTHCFQYMDDNEKP